MKKSFLFGICLLLVVSLFSFNQVQAQENATGVVVKLRSHSDLRTMISSMAQLKTYNNQNTSLNSTQFKSLFGNYYLVKNTNVPVETLLSQLKQNSNVEYAERDQNLTFAAIPNDPLYSSQYHHSLMNAPVAWDRTTGSNSVIIAIVDTGVDYTHPDLAPNMWHNASNEVGYDFGDGDNDPMDIQGHGTHMAGVVGAVGNNATGVTGINWNVKIMAVKVVGINALSAPTSTVANGIRFAADNGARVINMSFGAPGIYSQTIVDAINYAYSKGAVIIASSGNYV